MCGSLDVRAICWQLRCSAVCFSMPDVAARKGQKKGNDGAAGSSRWMEPATLRLAVAVRGFSLASHCVPISLTVNHLAVLLAHHVNQFFSNWGEISARNPRRSQPALDCREPNHESGSPQRGIRLSSALGFCNCRSHSQLRQAPNVSTSRYGASGSAQPTGQRHPFDALN
jgi:hypothetical protein